MNEVNTLEALGRSLPTRALDEAESRALADRVGLRTRHDGEAGASDRQLGVEE